MKYRVYNYDVKNCCDNEGNHSAVKKLLLILK